jgi:hypothetical protein
VGGGGVSFVTLWPTGQSRPLVNTVVEPRGRVHATNAIVPAGTSGSIDIFASNLTNLVIGVSGCFSDASSWEYYPITPCRVIETRPSELPSLPGLTPPFGSPRLEAGIVRSFPIPQGRCNIPSSAQAYYLNFTVVPAGPLGYMTVFPTGQAQPFVSTLNSIDGRVLANGAIAQAGVNGGVSVFATDPTDLVVDIAGYFAPAGGGASYVFNTVNPCRAATLAGSYTLCAAAANSNYLDPCDWGLPAPSPSISANSLRASATITLNRGVVIPVRLEDTGQLLTRHESKSLGAHIMLGVLSPGLRYHELPVELIVRSAFFRIRDASGVTLAQAASAKFPISIGRGPQARSSVVKFTIDGTNN